MIQKWMSDNWYENKQPPSGRAAKAVPHKDLLKSVNDTYQRLHIRHRSLHITRCQNRHMCIYVHCIHVCTYICMYINMPLQQQNATYHARWSRTVLRHRRHHRHTRPALPSEYFAAFRTTVRPCREVYIYIYTYVYDTI